ncbi:hypothetical protein PR048_021841 [Dryococelus australis]|uniref:Uncharacterized protein n=1 Tax=Dryococelus australis TaxID=614101 RepID=A0ABQ9GZF4_9NEOP|nr:hypothetical protein PR048_021841 [Dryococelus australis]
MYLFATHTYQNVETITRNYFAVGHTQNDGDSMHSCIEKQNKESFGKRPCLRTLTEHTYHAGEVNFTEFNDSKILSDEMGSNFTVDENEDDVAWNDIRVSQVKNDHK